jgi:transcriptional regulator
LIVEDIVDRMSSKQSDTGLKDLYKSDRLVYFINENRVTKCPEIDIKFKDGHSLRAIIDSGSEVNIILERAFEEINKFNLYLYYQRKTWY